MSDIDNQANMAGQILSLSKVLMAVPSVRGDIKNLDFALEIVDQELKEFKSKQFVSNNITSMLYYTNADSYTTTFKILLSANLDVGPGTEEQFHPREQNGKLYGRGAIVKTTAASMVMAFKIAAMKVKYPIALQIITDLQSAALEGMQHQLEKGVRSEFALAFAATRFHISNQMKGILWLKIMCKGEKSSGAFSWLGRNAAWEMKHFLDKLEARYPEPKKDIWVTIVNLAKLDCPNEMINVIPDECTAWLDIRYVAEEKDTILQTIESFMTDKFSMEILTNLQPVFISQDNHYLSLLMQSYQRITHINAHVIKNNFANAVQYLNQAGIPGVSFGVMGEGSYTDNEWVDIKSIGDYYAVVKDFLLSAAKM